MATHTKLQSPNTNILNMAGTAVIDDNSSDSDDEITRILENKDSKNTKRSTKNAILAFHASLKDVKNAEKDMKSLDENLAKFFAKRKRKTERSTKQVHFKLYEMVLDDIIWSSLELIL